MRPKQTPEYDGVIIHASSYNDLMTGVNHRNMETGRKMANLNAANVKRAAQEKENNERLLERQRLSPACTRRRCSSKSSPRVV